MKFLTSFWFGVFIVAFGSSCVFDRPEIKGSWLCFDKTNNSVFALSFSSETVKLETSDYLQFDGQKETHGSKTFIRFLEHTNYSNLMIKQEKGVFSCLNLANPGDIIEMVQVENSIGPTYSKTDLENKLKSYFWYAFRQDTVTSIQFVDNGFMLMKSGINGEIDNQIRKWETDSLISMYILRVDFFGNSFFLVDSVNEKKLLLQDIVSGNRISFSAQPLLANSKRYHELQGSWVFEGSQAKPLDRSRFSNMNFQNDEVLNSFDGELNDGSIVLGSKWFLGFEGNTIVIESGFGGEPCFFDIFYVDKIKLVLRDGNGNITQNKRVFDEVFFSPSGASVPLVPRMN